jgi:lipopolysaccharide export LptBFGC system permease protein LptF
MSSRTLKILGVIVVTWVVIFTVGYYLLFNAGGTVPEDGYGDPVPAPVSQQLRP